MYSWIPLYTELAEKLCAWEQRQPELIELLEQIRAKGNIVTPLNDRDQAGETFLMKEIDPFTFFGVFNRGIKEQHRIAIVSELKKHFQCEAELPTDFTGIPILNNQQSWFIAYQHSRKRDDVKKLWEVFRLALEDEPLDNKAFRVAFDNALEVRGVNVNLTMGLFWIRPDTFLNLDATNRSYLGTDLKEGLSAEFYVEEVKRVAEEEKKPFVEVSYDAYQRARKKPEEPPEDPKDKSYWLVGAFWSDNEPPDQTQRFIDEGIWENGYQDKYLDEVKQMKVGERIAIKSVATQKYDLPFDAGGETVSRMTIKAIGTIVANRGDGRTVEVEWKSDFEPKDWFFFTFQKTLWRLRLTKDYQHYEYAKRLIDFAFHGGKQDYEWFCEEWYGEDAGKKGNGTGKGTDGLQPYSVDDILAEGAFLTKDELTQTLTRLQVKKNLILQGAPGVGKTFLAKRLAYALLEEKDNERVEFVQFHQSYSYEDFVRGYRPKADAAGTFALKDGPFFRFCEKARGDERPYVFIIDEINRGNLSQIFGELMMLIEQDKRGDSHSVPLMYSNDDSERFSVPENLYIIGMMNLADRSLALVDYALRRRFAFMTLTPKFGSQVFRKWLTDREMDGTLVDLIMDRMGDLNQSISSDELLGENYQIGHSFFCPRNPTFKQLDKSWYGLVVETEIVPLLREYWFDNPGRAKEASEKLLQP